MTRPAYTPSYTLANATSTNANATTTPAPSSGSSTNVGAIAGGVVGGVVFIAILAILVWFLRRRKRRNATQAVAIHEAPAESKAASELPSYSDTKKGAVEVYDEGMMGFTPYGSRGPHDTPTQHNPAELQTEANDTLRPLSTDTMSMDGTSTLHSPSLQSSVMSSPALTPSAAFAVPERKPVGSPVVRHSLQSISSAGNSAGNERLSRQSEVSEVSK